MKIPSKKECITLLSGLLCILYMEHGDAFDFSLFLQAMMNNGVYVDRAVLIHVPKLMVLLTFVLVASSHRKAAFLCSSALAAMLAAGVFVSRASVQPVDYLPLFFSLCFSLLMAAASLGGERLRVVGRISLGLGLACGLAATVLTLFDRSGSYIGFTIWERAASYTSLWRLFEYFSNTPYLRMMSLYAYCPYTVSVHFFLAYAACSVARLRAEGKNGATEPAEALLPSAGKNGIL